MKANTVVRAAAEFVTIVVGVLVALAVGSWASEREDRMDEIQYLEQLAEELTRDSDILATGLIPGAERGQIALESVASVVSGAAQFPSDTMALLLDVLAGRGAQSVRLGTRATVDELLSTGSLRLIESGSLRSAIVGYYGNKDLAERRVEAMRSGYPDIVNGRLPRAPAGGLVGTGSDDDQQDLLRSYGLTRAARVMVATDFQEAITGQQNFLRLLVPMLKTVLIQNEELTAAVQAELGTLR